MSYGISISGLTPSDQRALATFRKGYKGANPDLALLRLGIQAVAPSELEVAKPKRAKNRAAKKAPKKA